MKIRKILKRCTAAMLAAAIGITTLAANVSAEVVYSSEAVGYVTKDLVSNGSWSSWCTYDGVDYPQEVTEKLEENSKSDSSSED